MARYIDADKISLRLLSVAITDDLYGMGIKTGIDTALRIIKEQPTADVVEVVRCKDCKYQEQCCEFVMISGRDKELVFCSYGERKL